MGHTSGHIEKLPEDILLYILQSLPIIDAVSTAPVSQRWKNLWKKTVPQRLNLCFDVDNLIGVADKAVPRFEKQLASDFTYYRKNVGLRNQTYFGISSEIIEDFVKGVDMIMQCRQGEGQQDVLLGVKSLKIRFPLRGMHSNHIDNWISSTVTSITEQLILVFDIPSDLPSSYIKSDFYKFPFEVLLNQKSLNLEYLQLEFVSAKLPQNFDGFTTLRTLKLNCTGLAQEDIHKLLINCPLLEFLKIQKCRDLVALQVSSPLPHLKVLILQECCYYLRRIELWAENLSSFEFDTARKMDHLKLSGCHNLTKVAACNLYYIDTDSDYIRPLSKDFPYVSTLYLDLNLADLNVILRDNIFAHLKFLAIFLGVADDEKNIQYLPSLLNVAPMLEELELHVSEMGYEKHYGINNGRINGDPCKHLKRVAFTGFTGQTGQTMLAKYFLMKAKRLQVMTIDPLSNFYHNFDAMEYRGFPREIGQECMVAYKFLRKKTPKGVKLILVGKH